MALLPLVARHMVAGGPLTYGALLGVFGVGAIGGAFLGDAAARAAVERDGSCASPSPASRACAALLALGGRVEVAAAGTLIGGACWVLALSLFNITVQLSAPRWVLGRALALYQTAAFGGMALGSWLWGSVAENHGLAQALLAAAGAMIAAGLVGFRLPLPDRTDLNLDPLNRFVEPLLALDLKPRSGPIAIEVEYRIAEADVPDFLAAMADRQRLRIRDGARHWTLQRDLEDPELWIESYQTPTWTDYVRHNMRRTQADAASLDRVRAMHAGPDLPRVHRRIIRQARWTGEEPRPEAADRPPLTGYSAAALVLPSNSDSRK